LQEEEVSDEIFQTLLAVGEQEEQEVVVVAETSYSLHTDREECRKFRNRCLFLLQPTKTLLINEI
jgi:hypothetical protein